MKTAEKAEVLKGSTMHVEAASEFHPTACCGGILATSLVMRSGKGFRSDAEVGDESADCSEFRTYS